VEVAPLLLLRALRARAPRASKRACVLGLTAGGWRGPAREATPSNMSSPKTHMSRCGHAQVSGGAPLAVCGPDYVRRVPRGRICVRAQRAVVYASGGLGHIPISSGRRGRGDIWVTTSQEKAADAEGARRQLCRQGGTM